jgi:hypothetical protein
MCHFFAVLVCS